AIDLPQHGNFPAGAGHLFPAGASHQLLHAAARTAAQPWAQRREAMMQESLFDWQFAWEILPQLLRVSLHTLGITLAGFAIALVAGLILALMRRSRAKLASWPAAFFIEFIRSTPLLIQLYFLFYVLPEFGLVMSALVT